MPKNGFPALTQLGCRNSSIYQSTKLVAGAKNKNKNGHFKSIYKFKLFSRSSQHLQFYYWFPLKDEHMCSVSIIYCNRSLIYAAQRAEIKVAEIIRSDLMKWLNIYLQQDEFIFDLMSLVAHWFIPVKLQISNMCFNLFNCTFLKKIITNIRNSTHSNRWATKDIFSWG